MSESSVADDIGRQGEIEFDRIANKAGLLVGKIEPDRVGKDRYIEAKLNPRDEDVSFDTRPAPLACGIQIKSILKTTKVITLTLSVAERLAQSVQPAFVCIVRLDDDFEVVEMRLVHILDRALEKILKRLREEFAKGTIDLNSKTISFNVKDAKIIGKKALDLKQALQSAIGPDMDRYAETKATQKRTVGYNPSKHIHVEGSASGKIEDVVDGLLGLRPLNLNRFDISEERFGIRLPHPDFREDIEASTALFSPQPSSSCDLVVGEPDTDSAVEISCHAIFPPISGLPIEHFKARLTSKYLEAVFTAGAIDFKSAPRWDDIDRAHPMSEWITYFRILTALEKPDCPLVLRRPDGQEILGKARLNGNYRSGEAGALLRVLRAYNGIRSEAGVGDQPVKLGAVYDNYAEVMKVSRIIGGSSLRSDLSFKSARADAEENTPIGLLFLSKLTVDEETFAYALTCDVEAIHEGEETTWVQTSPLQFADIQAISSDESEMAQYQRRMMRVSRSKLSVSEVFGTGEVRPI